eukprot:2225993-Rhodomonas_salina.1
MELRAEVQRGGMGDCLLQFEDSVPRMQVTGRAPSGFYWEEIAQVANRGEPEAGVKYEVIWGTALTPDDVDEDRSRFLFK